MVNYGAPFGFFLKDRDWFKKFAVASLLTYTIIGLVPVLGWSLEITRRLAQGEAVKLPAWTGFGRLWKIGYKYWLVTLVWLLPVLLAVLILYLPLILARSLDPNVLLVVWGATLCCDLAFLFVYSSVYIFLLPTVMGLLAGTGSLGRAVNPLNAWRRARLHLGPHALVFVIVGLGMTTVISLLAPLTLFLLLPPMLVYTGMVLAHYAGQLYRMGGP